MLGDDYTCAQLTRGSEFTHIISLHPSVSTRARGLAAVCVCMCVTCKEVVREICVHHGATLCVDVKQGGREIGRSSLVAGKWGDLFFGSFPVKFPGDQDTENIYLYTHYVLHKREGEPERERERR